MSTENGAPDFTAARLQTLIEIDNEHFWFRGRRALVDRLLEPLFRSRDEVRNILDLGPGSGSFARSLDAAGFHVFALDFLREGLRALRRQAPGVRAVQTSATRLPLRENACDAALALDVLEHLDDEAALRELRRVLRPGGLLVVTVPAFPWLWSHRDDAAGHKRRYTSRLLVGRLTEAGFAIEQIGYYQFLLFPLAMVTRRLGRTSPAARDFEDLPPKAVNAVLSRVNRAEVALGRFIQWPFGSSLYAVARLGGPAESSSITALSRAFSTNKA